MKNKAYVGVDVGGTNIKAALVINAKIKKRIKLPTKTQLGLKNKCKKCGTIFKIKQPV